MTNTGKITLTVIFILLVVIGASSYFFFLKPADKSKSLVSDSTEKMGVTTNTKSDAVNTTAVVENPGSYVTLETDDESVSFEKVVYFFYANWCPTCIPVDKEISKNLDKIPEGLKIVRINYNDPDTDDAEEDLAKKYGITYQHTFVYIGSDGEVVKKWNGGGLDKIIDNTN